MSINQLAEWNPESFIGRLGWLASREAILGIIYHFQPLFFTNRLGRLRT